MILSSLLGLLSVNAAASVNMKEAGFAKSWLDFADLKRAYNSRSLHDGVFGFGWCADFEKSLRFEDRRVILSQCSQDEEIPALKIERVKGRLYYQDMVFDLSGRLLEYATDRGPRAFLTYDSAGLVRKISLNGKHIFHLKYDGSLRKIREISDSQGLKSDYTYKNQNLVRVKNSWGSVYRMTYDDVHNLTQVRYPDGSRERMDYAKDQDRIISYISRQGCHESYAYAQERTHLSATLTRRCEKNSPTIVRYEFWNAQDERGQSYLQTVKITEGSLLTEVRYDAVSGEAHAIRRRLPLRVAAGQLEGNNL